ncbi:MAG: aldehyde dehydrogenase family protein, partial [Flavobacteriales bacterium]|nr:aldehyde dehydrogenase family protein [Flavobacteriales bacterium]
MSTATAPSVHKINDLLKNLGIRSENSGVSTGSEWLKGSGETLQSSSPVDGAAIAEVMGADHAEYDAVVQQAQTAFLQWRSWPAPKRGEVVRQIGEELRKHKADLGKLVSYEMGKSYQEGLGEVQEMIDICDIAVGLSRQIYGLTIASERPGHRMMETWH